jgi:plastocyanin
MRTRYVLACAALAVVGACGGTGSGGTGPTPTLASIAVTPASMNLGTGDTQAITVTGMDNDGKTIAQLFGVRYTSRSTSVADVTALGDVAGLSAGSTTIDISVTVGGVTKSGSVAVAVAGGTLPSSADVAAVDVSNTFSPRTVVVRRAGTLRWIFGAVPHDVTFGSATEAPPAIPLVSNTTVSRTFNSPGTFQYDCTVHAGMIGFVVVR